MPIDEHIERLLAAFERETRGLFAPEDFARRGFEAEDRQGNRVAFPLTTLAIGAVPVAPDAFASHLDVATAATDAKRQAKKRFGNALFVERRKHT